MPGSRSEGTRILAIRLSVATARLASRLALLQRSPPEMIPMQQVHPAPRTLSGLHRP